MARKRFLKPGPPKNQAVTADAEANDALAPQGGTMSLMGHLGELRKRVTLCALCFVAASSVCLVQAEWFTGLLLSRGQAFQFVYIAPAELLLSYFRVALIGGAVIASPILIYHLWQFIRPGLLRTEKLGFGIAMTLGLGLFVLGAYFAYAVALPILLNFFATLDGSQTVRAMVSIQEYLNYVLSTLVIFGFVFECPLVFITLVALGLVHPNTLQKNFKYVVLIVLILAAVITPPDVTSQILVTVPLLALLELSILASRVIFRRKLRRAQEI